MFMILEILTLTLPISMIVAAIEFGPGISRRLEIARLDREQYGDSA